MIDPTSKPALPPVQPSGGVRPTAAAPTSTLVDAGGAVRGARFQALLEELDLRSQAMAKSAQEPLSAQSLPLAVEHARASLEDALQLSQSLLEAVRQSTAQAPASRGERT